jgi:hypothetical protein
MAAGPHTIEHQDAKGVRDGTYLFSVQDNRSSNGTLNSDPADFVAE